ncbi:TetR/AcrR family transcriptional regulator [Peribacillus muralis]|uniref:TetR/AcrR family transcriptional regulator n=1 Tax=Peribacillus muralis TaxID=264697 RepID=UPI001F4E1BA4|nr:TetR/AcrR family transcriptional regulator [Peribacillus muralis]MCK1992105.1 TetR/AcrR family transcriptional regulator [Peribacillus muralis]MCK2012661.1 TetR/AcrR family transcriptional regulator [Peribacillus muralis]
MKNRRQDVIDTAHKLFIEKGYQATSIQDILVGSGISKGTFYNYFPSKGELFIAIFRSFYKRIRHERDKLLINQDSADIEIFIQQIELQMMGNKQSKLLVLIEEVRVSNDEELKQFINQTLLLSIRWMHGRFLDIFGESKKPYLLDSVIIFHSMITHMNYFNHRETTVAKPEIQIIRYCMNRMIHTIDEVAKGKEQILDPELMDTWFPEFKNHLYPCHNDLLNATLELKKAINTAFPCGEHRTRAVELIDFIQDELMQSDNPREFLIESLLATLKTGYASQIQVYIESFEESINSCLSR